MTITRTIPLTAGQKLLNGVFWLSAVLLVFCLAWLGNTGIQVSRVADELSGKQLMAPAFEQYLKETASLASPAKVELDTAVIRAAMPTQIFEWLADFENQRAMDRLQTARPVIKAVSPGSLAERLGVRPADEVVNLNDGPVDSAYALHQALSKDPIAIEQSLKLTVRRYARVINFPLVIPAGTATDLASLGIVLDIPAGIALVGKAQVAAQAEQFEAAYARTVAPEWRSAYRESLAEFAWRLKSLAETQKSLSPTDPGFIRVDQLLAWHQAAFSVAVDRYLSGVTQSTDTQLRSLRGAVDAILGTLCAVALFVIAFLLRRRALSSG